MPSNGDGNQRLLVKVVSRILFFFEQHESSSFVFFFRLKEACHAISLFLSLHVSRMSLAFLSLIPFFWHLIYPSSFWVIIDCICSCERYELKSLRQRKRSGVQNVCKMSVFLWNKSFASVICSTHCSVSSLIAQYSLRSLDKLKAHIPRPLFVQDA